MKNKVLEQLLGFKSSIHFPKEECTVECSREKSIKEGTIDYLCIAVDKRFDDELRMKIMRPYTYNGSEGYGQAWVDTLGNYLSNFDNPIHPLEDEFIVAFKELVSIRKIK